MRIIISQDAGRVHSDGAPDLDSGVVAGGGDALAVGRPGDGGDGLAVAGVGKEG